MTWPPSGVFENEELVDVSGSVETNPDVGRPDGSGDPRVGGVVRWLRSHPWRVALLAAAVLIGVVSCGACSPAPRPSWVLVVGDSMVHGDTRFAVTGLRGPFDERTAAPVSWVGAGGENPLTGPHRWRNAVSAAVAKRGSAPAVLVVEACCSGWTTATSAAWRAELRAIADAAGARRVIAVTTPRPVPGSWYGAIDASVTGAQKDLLSVASARGWELVDLFRVWPVGTAGIHADDGLHFSPEGAKHAGWAVAGTTRM